MTPKWWQTGIIYQVYPRSFQDSNGDGIGDLSGIIRRLPYVAELGANAIWISPIFTSPMADFGYDVADYTSIDPLFGSMADFDSLVAQAHDHELRIILDLVPNHTSDRHPWFVESQSSRTNPKRDWYIWRDPRSDGGPPNNWLSAFGGTAWQFDASTNQYYYHAFLKEQPDLNWRNPQVRQAIYQVMRFWLRKGVDGFRLDVLWHLLKDGQFRDNPPNPKFSADDPPHHALLPLYTTDLPEIHDIIAEMRRVTDQFDDRVLIGEIYLPVERLVQYYGRDLKGVHLPFNFSLLGTSWSSRSVAELVQQYEAALPTGGWPNWVLGNHDNPRIATRLGPQQARLAGMLLLTLRGTPTMYYGDEIGMTDICLAPSQVRDPMGQGVPGRGRDGCRSPMQWDRSSNAGFSAGDPWLPVGKNYQSENVETLRSEATSLYRLYRALIDLRRLERPLSIGRYTPINVENDVLLYLREFSDERMLVALNFNDTPAAVSLLSQIGSGRILLSSHMDRIEEPISGSVGLRPHEGLVIKLSY